MAYIASSLSLSLSINVLMHNITVSQILMKKVDALTKAMEVESKKMKREAVARDKEAAAAKVNDNKKNRTISSSKRL